MTDFTLDKYGDLLRGAQDAGYQLYGIRDWIQQNPRSGIAVRHDIDRTPHNALTTAALEAEMKVRSTYYFRIIPNCFRPEIIEAVAKLGHEIGYHYEDLAMARGDLKKAIALFETHLEQMRAIAPIHTIAMHGSPISPHDNRTLWTQNDFRSFGLEAEAFLSINYADMYYFTDTGRTWGETVANLRDRPAQSRIADCDSTDDFIRFLKANAGQRIAFVTHPERWNNGIGMWHFQLLRDRSFNAIKRILRLLRKQGTQSQPTSK